MSRWRWRSAAALGLLVVGVGAGICGAPAMAFAQDGVEQRRDEAKKLADSAFDLLSKGLYQEAIDLFKKADDRFHSPVFVLFVAQAQEKLGKLVEARRQLQSVIDEKLAEYAPDSFREAQSQAKERAAALDERIPKVTVSISGDGAEGASVELDGRALGSDELAGPIVVDPGKHSVKVSARGELVDEKSFEVVEGDSETLEFEVAGASAPPPPEDGGHDGADQSSTGRNWLYPGIAFGVGGAGLIMGIAAGAVFLGKAGDLKDSCKADNDGDDKNCSLEPASKGDEVKLVGNIATAGFVIAGVGIAAGIVLAVIPMGDDEGSARLTISPTSLGVSGRF